MYWKIVIGAAVLLCTVTGTAALAREGIEQQQIRNGIAIDREDWQMPGKRITNLNQQAIHRPFAEPITAAKVQTAGSGSASCRLSMARTRKVWSPTVTASITRESAAMSAQPSWS